ncbi:hypothetical protein NX02_24185 [Sphingomonas sanxanigenens DSM 19645 = NX02]|uniref:Uncharacterized protein n=2 Tax=Sphingomonas sanxanigenens TaxID=397260 RepID=W0AL82_9SPHN|nr:hypothetical protein NX02_24185 [Sphingomonas sanxanigenens DSM 19645 = NX02]
MRAQAGAAAPADMREASDRVMQIATVDNRRRVPLRTRAKVPALVAAFLFLMMIPHTIAFYAGPVLVTSYRLFMILIVPVLIVKVMAPDMKFHKSDWLLVGFSGWACLCIFLNYPFSAAIERAGQLLLEVTCAYFLGRACFKSLDDIYSILNPLFIIVLLAFVIAIPEAISHRKPLIEYTSQLTGIAPGYYYDGTDVRMGLRRAQAFFENTILFGLFSATLVSLIWYMERRPGVRIGKLLVVIGAVLLSISTTPIISMMTQFVMIAIETATRRIKKRLVNTVVIVAIFALAVNTFTKSGIIGLVINYLAFNRASSYNRILIWDYGLINISAHPIFGMVPEYWVRAPWMKVSIDNFWIYNGLLSGYVGWALTALTLIVTLWQFLAIPKQLITPRHQNFRLAWTFIMLSFALCGFCGTFYGKFQPFYYFLVGMGAAAVPMYQRFAAERKKEVEGEQPARGRQQPRRRPPLPATA